MIKYLSVILISLLSIFIVQVNGQSDFLLHSQSLSPHQVVVNPSILPDVEFYLGLPAISNTYGAFSNNAFSYRDLIQKKAGTDSIFFNFDNFLATLSDNNFFYAGANSDLLSIGWREGRWYVGARITEVADLRFRFGKDLMNLAINGNGPTAGTEQNLGDLFLSASHYRKYSINLSRDINCKLRLGANVSYLYGMENIDVKRSNVTLLTDATTFDLSGESDILINTSGVENFASDSLRNWPYHFQRKNRGVSIDIGATYTLNESFEFSASVLDLGRLSWKHKPVNYNNSISSFTFTGIELNKFLFSSTDTIGEGIENFLDSLANVFSIEETNLNYVTPLPARIYLSAKYDLTNGNSLRLNYLGNTYKRKIYSSASVGYSKRINDIFEVSLLWAYHNNSVANLGAGFTLNLGFAQFSIMSDNVPALLGSYNAHGTSLRAGLTLVSGYGTERPDFCDTDKDGTPNNRDECPNDPGPVELLGCPDTDGDGIIDKLDECPDIAGSIEFKGCPDSDGDKVIDKLDKCPDTPGKLELDGCPDRDNDGVIDEDDDCPDLFGLKQFAGCPDSDGDGVPDKDDDCPQTYGPKEYSGCPDTDNDEIPDQHDRCPEEFGPKSNRGCPLGDRDGDGVLDKDDKCPGTPGPKENDGCPEITKEEIEILKTAFDNLEFESGKSIIESSSFASLDKLAELLNKKSDWNLRIAGHTDNVGQAHSNLTLSRERAEAVSFYISSKGIDSGRIYVVWFGQEKPVATNDTPEGRKKNRRVEMEIVFN